MKKGFSFYSEMVVGNSIKWGKKKNIFVSKLKYIFLNYFLKTCLSYSLISNIRKKIILFTCLLFLKICNIYVAFTKKYLISNYISKYNSLFKIFQDKLNVTLSYMCIILFSYPKNIYLMFHHLNSKKKSIKFYF